MKGKVIVPNCDASIKHRFWVNVYDDYRYGPKWFGQVPPASRAVLYRIKVTPKKKKS